MSLQFNDTTNYKGIVQMYEREVGFDLGTVSGDTTKLKQLTADVNIAFDEYMARAQKASGNWKADDINHTDYAIVLLDIVSGTRQYQFTTDEVDGSLIADIYRVYLKSDSSNGFKMLTPYTIENETEVSVFTNGLNAQGIPTKYAKQKNSILLDFVPNFSLSNALMLYVSREPMYFAYTDTTKKAGVHPFTQEYLYIKPAYDYARRNNLAVLNSLAIELNKCEKKIDDIYSHRDKDQVKRLRIVTEDCR